MTDKYVFDWQHVFPLVLKITSQDEDINIFYPGSKSGPKGLTARVRARILIPCLEVKRQVMLEVLRMQRFNLQKEKKPHA